MDIQVYFDNVVYPLCDKLVYEYEKGCITNEFALDIFKHITNINKALLDYNKGLGQVMVKDAKEYIIEKLNKNKGEN